MRKFREGDRVVYNDMTYVSSDEWLNSSGTRRVAITRECPMTGNRDTLTVDAAAFEPYVHTGFECGAL